MFKVVVFAGHYPNKFRDEGSKGVYTDLTPQGYYEEYDSNIEIAKETVSLLRQHEEIEVLFPQEDGNEYRSLESRVRYCNENNVDTAIFIHSNATSSKGAEGACAFFWDGSKEGEKFAELFAKEMDSEGYPLWSNGTYPCRSGTWSNFYVVRSTSMPVILSENFFFTNPRELKKYLLDPNQLKKIAEIHAKATCKYFGISYKGNTTKVSGGGSSDYPYDKNKGIGTLQVSVGLLNVRSDADVNSPIVKENGKLKRVEEGQVFYVYSKENGMYNIGGNQWVSARTDLVNFTPHPQNETPKEEQAKGEPILGKSKASIDQMVSYAKQQEHIISDKDLRQIATYFRQIGDEYGIRGDVAFAQACLETHYFRFDLGTAVTPDQHNYYGCGVVKKGIKGDSYNTIKDGVTAHIQHLFCYATTEELDEDEIIDERFFDWLRGTANTWIELSNKWAMNSEYGEHILDIHKRIVEHVPVVEFKRYKNLIDAGIIEDKNYEEYLDEPVSVKFFLDTLSKFYEQKENK